MKKIMVVGAVNSGKTSLLMTILGESGCALKTQTINYRNFTIDTPGEYIENPSMYRAIIAASNDARCILFIQDSTANKFVFPPRFAQIFNCMSIGVVTKIDHNKSNVEKASSFLSQLGLSGPIFKVSAFTREGINELKDFIEFCDNY